MFGNGVILALGETMINGVRDISPIINNIVNAAINSIHTTIMNRSHPVGSYVMIQCLQPGEMGPIGFVNATTFINNMRDWYGQIWVLALSNTPWGNVRMDVLQRRG